MYHNNSLHDEGGLTLIPLSPQNKLPLWGKEFQLTLDEGDFVPRPPLPHIVAIFSMCYGLIISTALTGNTLVIMLLILQRSLRAVTDMFLFSLAVSDLLIISINMPLQLYSILHPEWTLGLPACKFKEYFQSVTILSSVLTLLVIAIDRYLTICHPLRMRTIHTRHYGILMLVGVWTTSLLVSVPQILIGVLDTSKLVRDEKGDITRLGTVCLDDFTGAGMNKSLFNILTYLFYFIMPVFIIGAAYGAVVRVLWNRASVGDHTQRQADVNMKQKRRLVRMLVTVVTVFVICWLPFFTATLVRSFNKEAQHFLARHHLHKTLQLIGYANSFTNPIIFTFMSPRMRKNLCVLLRKKCSCCFCCCCRSKGHEVVTVTASTVTNGRQHTISHGAHHSHGESHFNRITPCENNVPNTVDRVGYSNYALPKTIQE